MNVTKIKGLKYPDEYFVKFFFRNGLQNRKNLHFLEFGCGNGSNLMLPYSFEHTVTGIDYDKNHISNAKHNFQWLKAETDYKFYADDMRETVKRFDFIADVLILPSVIYYISKEEFIDSLYIE